MNADQWGQVADLFQQSIALPEPDRQAFLMGSPYSPEVRDQVARLLVGDAGAESAGSSSRWGSPMRPAACCPTLTPRLGEGSTFAVPTVTTRSRSSRPGFPASSPASSAARRSGPARGQQGRSSPARARRSAGNRRPRCGSSAGFR